MDHDIKFDTDPARTNVFPSMVPCPVSSPSATENETLYAMDKPLPFPVSPKVIKVDPNTGLPHSAVDQSICAEAPICHGKTTTLRKLTSLGAEARDSYCYFPRGHQKPTIKEK